MSPNELPRRFRDNIYIEPNTGCWLWLGPVYRNGYGQINFFYIHFLAHRFFYELFIGPIPPGLDLDHLCETRLCCYPGHVEPVTRQINLIRAGHYNLHKTHCLHGHLLAGENLMICRGKRGCRACQNERSLKRYHERKKCQTNQPAQ